MINFLTNIKQGFKRTLKKYGFGNVGQKTYKVDLGTVQRLGFLEIENKKLKEKITQLEQSRTNRKVVNSLVRKNDELEGQLNNFLQMHNDFPTVLRKMWSGGEVVA